jgi:hypothetical protein
LIRCLIGGSGGELGRGELRVVLDSQALRVGQGETYGLLRLRRAEGKQNEEK